MTDKLKFPIFPFTYLKNDMSVKGITPAFSPGISKHQLFVLIFLLLEVEHLDKKDIQIKLEEFYKLAEIDKDAPAFPFTTFINEQQVIAPGITIYELIQFVEHFNLSWATLPIVAKEFFE
jgi:hypothetical protein